MTMFSAKKILSCAFQWQFTPIGGSEYSQVEFPSISQQSLSCHTHTHARAQESRAEFLQTESEQDHFTLPEQQHSDRAWINLIIRALSNALAAWPDGSRSTWVSKPPKPRHPRLRNRTTDTSTPPSPVLQPSTSSSSRAPG